MIIEALDIIVIRRKQMKFFAFQCLERPWEKHRIEERFKTIKYKSKGKKCLKVEDDLRKK
jgi:hypothetical protein